MHRARLAVGGLMFFFLVFGGLAAAPAMAQDMDSRFEAIYHTEWQWRQDQFADDEDSDGEPADGLPAVDAATQDKRRKYWTDVLDKLDAIDVGALSAANQVNYKVYRYQIETHLSDQQYKTWEMPFNGDTGFWMSLGFTARGHNFHSREAYEHYLQQLRDVPGYFADQIANMKKGLARGYSQPKLIVDGIEDSISEPAKKAGKASPFYQPFESMPDTIDADDKAALRRQAVALINDKVIPAYHHLYHFMHDVYATKTRDTIDVYDLPDGKAYYQAQIYKFTTLHLTPEQIHERGVKAVRKIHAQMLKTIDDAGFDGSFAEFQHFLRTDPRFYAKTPEELLKDAAWISKQIDGKVGQYIGRMPRRRFAIKPVPADLAPFYTGGRGGPGIYLVNTYDLPSRPLYVLPALTLHEAEPGHATQMPLAAEFTDQPAFRRDSFISAYGEGWAVYCEYLGNEMGLYDTPYKRFGYLSYQAWRAARLVVDTGIHAMGWSRQRAVDYLEHNTALSEHEIQTEVNRYIAWPGQALSYYLGEQDILDERHKAEKALGRNFDVRAFHDAVLSTGSVPLNVLNDRIDRFIADGGRSPYANAD